MDLQEKLQQLKDMHDKGLITATVFETQQKAILADSAAQPSRAPSFPASKKLTSLAAKAGTLVLVALSVIWLIHSTADKEGRDAINQFASQTGIGTQVISWSDRAETAARKIVEANRETLAKAIQGITHPTGKEPSLSRVSVSKLNDRVLVDIVVDWKGGLIGGAYSTSVNWEINKQGHIQAKVFGDTAVTEIQAKNKEMLNEYFRTKVYPAFYSDMGG